MTTAVQTAPTQQPYQAPTYFEKLLNGDLTELNDAERKAYYLERCARLELDPSSQPFLFMQTKARDNEPSKTVLYATRGATDQIGKRDGLTGSISKWEVLGSIAIVAVKVTDGRRSMENIGAASFKYDYQAGDALKRATTQAYRRAIIQFAGLGMVSEEDLTDIQGAQTLGMLGIDVEAQPSKPALPPAEDTTAAYLELVKLQGQIHDLTGELVESPESMTLKECRREYTRLTGLLKAAQAKTKGNEMAKVLSDADAEAFIAMNTPI